jgi:hypothetical protein
MEIVLGLLALVVVYWVFQSKSAGQASIRYQAHKDAIDEARRVVNKYPHQKGTDYDPDHGVDLGEKYFFDLRSGHFPPDIRHGLVSTLDNLAFHAYESRIPHDLGNAEHLNELLTSLETARRLEADSIPDTFRQRLRQWCYRDTVAAVQRNLKDIDKAQPHHPKRWRQRSLHSLRDLQPDLVAALSWYKDVDEVAGCNVAVTTARDMSQRVTAILQDPSNVADIEALDRESSA